MSSRADVPTPLAALPPDQRAAVELVLRRGLGYAALAERLGLAEAAVRERARRGVEALAPDLPPPSESGRLADWLLGQQDPGEAARTRAALADAPVADRRWAETVAAPLRAVGGDRVPLVPAAPDPDPAAPDPDPAAPDPDPAAPASTPERRSSRLGGAVVLGVLALAVAGVLAFVLTRGDEQPGAATAAPAATATASGPAQAAAPGAPAGQASSDDVVLTGTAGSRAAGLMRLLTGSDGRVHFALAAQGLAANTRRDSYAIWLTRRGLPPRRLGFAQTPVGADGALTTGGPLEQDVDRFPRWFATYDAVLVTRETRADAKRPGEVVLRGALPHASRQR
jgi:Sigma-70, region 4